MKLLRKEDYTVGWICALPFPEWKASRLLLDEVHEDLSLGPGVKNQYVYGSMNGHNIVMGCLPSSQMGRGAAASVASEMGVIFPFLRFGLLVGVGGGVPSDSADIRLGDVVVSQPDQVEHHGGVIQYDYGKTVQEGTSLQDTGLLNQPPYILLSALSKIQSAPRSSSKFGEYLDALKHNEDDPDFLDTPRHDRLFQASFVHPHGMPSCDSCSAEHEVKRAPRRDAKPIAHFGTIASGDQVMKSAPMRDTLSKKHNGILCFEMEAAGLMNQFPCLVIRGICDYCDSHKNKTWQPFAAAVAAAWAKELLRNVAAGERPVDGISTAPLTVQRDLAKVKAEDHEHRAVGDSKRRREQIKAFLGPSPNPQDTFERTNKQRAPGTGEWIRYDPTFTSWLGRSFPVLWVSGTPGAGKTFLSASMASYLRQTLSSDSSSGAESSVGFYFFKDNNSNTRGFAQALRDVAFQLCQTDTAYEMHVEDLSNTGADIESLEGAWKRLFRDFWIREQGHGADTQSAAYFVLDGVDEAFQPELKEFLDHLQDLNFDSLRPSRLQIVLVGRTHLTDDVSDALPMGQFHDIRVDLDKTAEDIKTYVKGSMKKSRLLRKVSRKLQDEVLTILSAQSNGMFLWVDLMLRELNSKRSEREVSEALHKAPKGIFAILTHVLEGLSESLQKEDADDFNDLLQWVASAPEPVTLGVLDSMLKFKSPTGDSVVLLESRLRRQYASFFNVLRIDGLTTAELQKSNRTGYDFAVEAEDDSEKEDDDERQSVRSPFVDEDVGLDDFDADFDSDLDSTYVVFTHASIGDFFREKGGAKVHAPGGFSVGIEIESARLQTLKTVIEILMEEEPPKDSSEPQDEEAAERAKGVLALKKYARPGFFNHILTADPSKVSAEEKREFAPVLFRFFRTKEGFSDWVKWINVLPPFWTGETMPTVRRWLEDTDGQEGLSEDEREWVKSTSATPFAMLEPIAMFHAERWLQDTFSVPTIDFRFIRKYRQMLDASPESPEDDSEDKDPKEKNTKETDPKDKSSSEKEEESKEDDAKAPGSDADDASTESDEEEKTTVQDILDEAEWAGFEKTALWYRRLAMVVRDTGSPDESKAFFEKAIELDPDMLEARGGLARVYMIQENHAKSLEVLEESVPLLRAKLARAPAADVKQTAHWLSWDLINSGKCYEALGRIEEACDAFLEAWETNPLAGMSALEYVRLNDTRDECQACVDFLRKMERRRDEESECSYLTKFITMEWCDMLEKFLMIMARVCMVTDEAAFLYSLMRHGIAHCVKRKALDQALLLELLLGCMYAWLPETEERAVQIMERYAGMKSSAETHPAVAFIHGIGMAALAGIHFDRAWKAYGTPECRTHLEKLEALAATHNPEMSLEYDSTPSCILGAWLRSHGQPGDAVAHFRPHIARALREIDADAPDEARSELIVFANMLILAGDEANTAAVYRTLLKTEAATKEQVEEDFSACDGFCSSHAYMWLEQSMFICKNCHSTRFCAPCLDKVRTGTGGKLLANMCSPQHEWLRVDVPGAVVPEGRMLVGETDETVGFDEWKQGIRRAWNIK